MAKHNLRYINAVQSVYSYILSSLTKRATVSGLPPAISFELTNSCNLNCPECMTGSGTMTRDKGYMDYGMFDKIIGQLGPYLLHANLYFQGEPMLHPEFFSFIERCKGFRTTVSTNGHFLDSGNANRLAVSGLYKLIVSVDGATPESYNAYRKNGNFEKVMEGLFNVSKAVKSNKSGLKLVIQCLVYRENEGEIKQLKLLAKKLGASLELKSMQVLDRERIERWAPRDANFNRYTKKGGEYSLKSRLPNRCSRLWLAPAVTWDGKVLPCCFDKDANWVMGDLNNNSFKEIWQSPKYYNFRNGILSNRSGITICNNCCSGINGVKI